MYRELQVEGNGLQERRTAGRNVFKLQFKDCTDFDPTILLLRIYPYISWGLTWKRETPLSIYSRGSPELSTIKEPLQLLKVDGI